MPVIASKDNPRTLERKRDGARVRCMDQIEYVSLTSAHGYRDVTDDKPSGGRSRGSGSSGSAGSSDS